MRTTSKTLWAARVNLNGLYASSPRKLHYDKELGEYYSRDGALSIEDAGTTERAGCITFASELYSTAETWIMGVKAAHKLIHALCKYK